MQEDVNPNTPESEYDQTPLSWAAEGRCEGVEKLLIAREDLNPNSPSRSSQIALILAGEYRHDRVVERVQARQSGLSGN